MTIGFFIKQRVVAKIKTSLLRRYYLPSRPALLRKLLNRSRCYVDSVSPCIALNHSLGMRRGRYAEFPPLTMILYQYISTHQSLFLLKAIAL